MSRFRFLGCGLVVAASAMGALAAETNTVEAVELHAVEAADRNPFAASGALQSRAYVAPNQTSGASRFVPSLVEAKLPSMRMRGYVKNPDGEVLALLEVDGSQVHLIRVGDTVGLNQVGSDTVLRIKSISRRHLVVESGSLGKVIIVR